MKATITEKAGIRVKQFAWDNQVLYLHIKDTLVGRRDYFIKDTPLDDGIYTNNICLSAGGCNSMSFNNKFLILTPIGKLDMVYSDIDIATQVKKNIELINRNIEYLQNLKEILDYIQILEAEYAK